MLLLHLYYCVDSKKELEYLLDSGLFTLPSSPTHTDMNSLSPPFDEPKTNKRVCKATDKGLAQKLGKNPKKKKDAVGAKERQESTKGMDKKKALNASLKSMSEEILSFSTPLLGVCNSCESLKRNLKEKEDELADANDAIEAKKSQVSRLQKQLGLTIMLVCLQVQLFWTISH